MESEKCRPNPRLGKNGLLLDVPENADFIRRLRATPTLSAAQLVRLSRVYRRNPALISLADHLFRNAILMIAATNVAATKEGLRIPAMAEVWKALADTDQGSSHEDEPLSPSSDPPEDPEIPGLPDNAPVDICEFKCTWWTVFFIGTGILWENCGHGWHPIGACLEG